MGCNLMLRRAAFGAALFAGVCAVSPAVAGRCGHSYAVDAPTTLSKVARACNVSYSALVEANRGVDPGYVRPGEHLAVPDEVDNPAQVAAPATDAGPQSSSPGVSHPYIASRPTSSYQPYTDDSDVRRVSASASAAGPTTYFDTFALPIHARQGSHLSYQKMSAARIRNAGYSPQPPVTPSGSVFNGSGVVKSISTYPTPLLECSVLRRQPDGKIRQVREVKIGSDQEDMPAHCISLNANGPVRAIVTPGVLSGETARDDLTVLRGRVLAVNEQCVTLESDDGEIWRMSAPLEASDMLGKDATVWAIHTRALTCGGLVLDHAVYAERL